MRGDNADVVVIGAGPAGMAAAVELAGRGVNVTVLDEHPAPGGQIYRNVDAVAQEWPDAERLLGVDYLHGRGLTAALSATSVDYRSGATVWQGERAASVAYAKDGRAEVIRARFVIAATGALERAVPVRGWTLPGVMTAGAAQLALKTAGLVPAGRVVLAGCGPLLLLVAGQLAGAGAEIAAVLGTTPVPVYMAAEPFVSVPLA